MDPDYDLFAAIVAAGSLSGAGRSLGVSPAMISKRLTRLEARLGTRLLHRTTRRLALTPQGQGLHDDLLGILSAIRDAENRVAGAAGVPSGQLRVSAPTSFGRVHVAPHLAMFMALHPAVALAFDLSDGFVDLMGAQVDLAIRITTPGPSGEVGSGLVAHRLADSERVLCAAPAYIEAFGALDDIDALKGHRILAASGQLPWRIIGPNGPVTIEGRSHVQTNSSEVVREVAIAGAGIALRSLWDVTAELADGTLCRVLPAFSGGRDVGIYAVHPAMPKVPPAMAAFIAFLTDLFDPAPWEDVPVSRR
ncbi:LysR family transcriptional regulator [soil metagenome]